MGYRIPEEFISKKDVQLHFYWPYNSIEIELSKNIKDVIATWPKNKQRNILSDIKTSVEYACLFEQDTLDTFEQGYHQLFTTLRQVY
jgi:hypothetical protein